MKAVLNNSNIRSYHINSNDEVEIQYHDETLVFDKQTFERDDIESSVMTPATGYAISKYERENDLEKFVVHSLLGYNIFGEPLVIGSFPKRRITLVISSLNEVQKAIEYLRNSNRYNVYIETADGKHELIKENVLEKKYSYDLSESTLKNLNEMNENIASKLSRELKPNNGDLGLLTFIALGWSVYFIYELIFK